MLLHRPTSQLHKIFIDTANCNRIEFLAFDTVSIVFVNKSFAEPGRNANRCAKHVF